MKICVAQTRPVAGDIAKNILAHLELIELAISAGVNTIIFPELSLTGYEPSLAKELATSQEDELLSCFQEISDARKLTIGVGVPTRIGEAINISMVIFQPGQPRQLYSKQYLHADEEPFFTSGTPAIGILGDHTKMALAICYELSVPAHSEQAFRQGAEVYIASVAKTASGVEKAIDTLCAIARKYSMTVLLSNCVGKCDGEECGGRSTVWNKEGFLIGQMDDTSEGILVIDTETSEVILKDKAHTHP